MPGTGNPVITEKGRVDLKKSSENTRKYKSKYCKQILIMFRLGAGLMVFSTGLISAGNAYSQRTICGHFEPYTDMHGCAWEADQAYTPGGWGYIGGDDWTAFPSDIIENSYDGMLFKSERRNQSYQFDGLAPGQYFIKLLFAENYFGLSGNGGGINSRVFNITINGQEVLADFDILKETGGRARRAVVKRFAVEVLGSGSYANIIRIDTNALVNQAKFSAIEISDTPTLTDTLDNYYKASAGEEETFRINCGGTKSLEDGTFWMADEPWELCRRWGYINGLPRVNPPYTWTQPEDYRLATWREGGVDFKYVCSLPNGIYEVKLIFVENEFNAAGERVFDVSLNGSLLAGGLDVYGEAGAGVPYELNSPVTVENERIEITFPSILSGQAMISAIEIRGVSVSDNDFLDFVQRRALDFFIFREGTFTTVNPANGLVVERTNNFISRGPGFASLGSVGFGLAALASAAGRGWIPRNDAEQRILTTVDYFKDAQPFVDNFQNELTHKNGFFFRWLEITSGQRLNDIELSSVDTGLLLAGMLTAAGDFPGTAIETSVQSVRDRANWEWFVNANPEGFVSIGWKPDEGFDTTTWSAYNDGIIADIIGLSSSTYPLLPKAWFNMRRFWQEYSGTRYIDEQLEVPTPLFAHIYLQCFLDLREQYDDKADYFINTSLAAQVNKQFCQDHAGTFLSYSEGGWGLTSGDSPQNGFSYVAYRTKQGYHDGTVNPSIVGAAIPFAPEIAVPALRRMYFRYKHFLWGRFGFADSYNLNAPTTLDKDMPSGQGWVSPDVIGIDLGSMTLSIENYRTGFVWTKFTQTSSVQSVLAEIGMGNPLIDNLDNDGSLNDAPQERDVQWWTNDYGVFTFTAVAAGIGGNATPCLKVDYDKKAGDEYDFIGLGDLLLKQGNPNYANMSYYLYDAARSSLPHGKLSMQVYGTVALQIKFKDKDGNESASSGIYFCDHPQAWGSATWDYTNLNWNQCDPRQIQDILIYVQPGDLGSGTFYIDNVKLGNPAPLPSSESASVNITVTVVEEK